MPRTCLACGKAGHRLDSCKSKAAVEIRRLRSILEKTRHKVGARNNPGRKNRKSGYTKEKARKAYAKNNVRKTYCEKRKKDSRATWSGFRQNLKKQNGNHLLAYETLLQHGFLHRPTRCLACGCRSLGPPVETDKPKVVTVYVQCGMRKCRTKNHVVSCGIFRGLRVNCSDLLRAIENYCGQSYMHAPHTATMELATGIGRYPCEHIVHSLSALEKDAGKKFSDSLTVGKWRSWSWCDSST